MDQSVDPAVGIGRTIVDAELVMAGTDRIDFESGLESVPRSSLVESELVGSPVGQQRVKKFVDA